MWQDIASFLLEIPPLDEIGGKITSIIEQYRAGVLKKQDAMHIILTDHKRFLEIYAEMNEKIKY